VAIDSIPSSAIRDLAGRITRHLDADRDGKLSTTEFSQFLSTFFGMGGPQLQSMPTNRQPVGTMEGFDANKMTDASVTTTKYKIGRVLQMYPNTPDGLRQALPELQQVVPGVTIAGRLGDLLDFGDYVDPFGIRIGVIDVIRAATPVGGEAWQWLPVS
jgi:hypothetical protein